jgi:cysteine desulfurase
MRFVTDAAYLDWNGAAPLCDEAKRAMLDAMDVVGNPSSVHSGGRLAKAMIDGAREDVAALVDCDPGEVIFTSGATEATNWVLRGADWTSLFVPAIEHDAVLAAADRAGADRLTVSTATNGQIDLRSLRQFMSAKADGNPLVCIQAANSETGVVQDVHAVAELAGIFDARVFTDACQAIGRKDDAGNGFSFARSGAHYAAIAGEKFGGPAGVGALIIRKGCELKPFIVGGGQEMRLRSGTENLIGIAGMGAAAKAARKNDASSRIHQISAYIRSMIATVADDVMEFGIGSPRLVNTTCFAVPGWKASTQMMQLDLQGVAVSAGSACSSGKVSESKVLRAMGHDRFVASSAIRASIGRTTTEGEVARFVEVWSALYRERAAKGRADLIDLDTDRLKGTTNG